MSHEADNRPTPLEELRVVEISDRLAGSYCGKLLVDAGAQVRKVEPPQGDPLRAYSATCSPVPAGQASPLFCYLNAGKSSLSVSPESQRGPAIIITLNSSKSIWASPMLSTL